MAPFRRQRSQASSKMARDAACLKFTVKRLLATALDFNAMYLLGVVSKRAVKHARCWGLSQVGREEGRSGQQHRRDGVFLNKWPCGCFDLASSL